MYTYIFIAARKCRGKLSNIYQIHNIVTMMMIFQAANFKMIARQNFWKISSALSFNSKLNSELWKSVTEYQIRSVTYIKSITTYIYIYTYSYLNFIAARNCRGKLLLYTVQLLLQPLCKYIHAYKHFSICFYVHLFIVKLLIQSRRKYVHTYTYVHTILQTRIDCTAAPSVALQIHACVYIRTYTYVHI